MTNGLMMLAKNEETIVKDILPEYLYEFIL